MYASILCPGSPLNLFNCWELTDWLSDLVADCIFLTRAGDLSSIYTSFLAMFCRVNSLPTGSLPFFSSSVIGTWTGELPFGVGSTCKLDLFFII